MLTFAQIFNFIDSNGPVITCPDDYTVASNSLECSADLTLPFIIATDACNQLDRIDVDYPGGFMSNGNGATINLPMGDNLVTYIAYDILGNSSTCSFTVSVEDLDAPTAICETYTVASIPQEGFVDIDAFVFDDGSYDYCGLEKYEVRRMTDGCDNDDQFFGESIRVCCEDVGIVTVDIYFTKISFRVWQ